jgi:hypothetical protein
MDAQYVLLVIVHAASDFLLRQPGLIASISRSEHWPNVSLPFGFLMPLGLIPSASLARASIANSRARASVTSRAEPKPSSVCLPCQRNMNTQLRAPLSEIER